MAHDSSAQKESRKIDSLATDQFWSRAPYKFGPYAVKFTLQPSGSAAGKFSHVGRELPQGRLHRAAPEGTHHV